MYHFALDVLPYIAMLGALPLAVFAIAYAITCLARPASRPYGLTLIYWAVSCAVIFALTGLGLIRTFTNTLSTYDQFANSGFWLLCGLGFPTAIVAMVMMGKRMPRVRREDAKAKAVTTIPAIAAGIACLGAAVAFWLIPIFQGAAVEKQRTADIPIANQIPMEVKKTTTLDDKYLTPFKSMYKVDRTQWHLAPLEGQAIVVVSEPAKGAVTGKADFDALLNIQWRTELIRRPAKTVYFRSDGKEYRWVGETDWYSSPEVDAEGHPMEIASIAYMAEPILSYRPGQSIRYENARDIEFQSNLTLKDIEPHLKTMGFDAP
jgi:hypothetical protein